MGIGIQGTSEGQGFEQNGLGLGLVSTCPMGQWSPFSELSVSEDQTVVRLPPLHSLAW